MTAASSVAAFAVAAGLLTITPGLDTALVLRTAAVEGRRPALHAALGICLGVLLWGVLVAFGLGSLVESSRQAYSVVLVLGASYLSYLGMRLIRQSRVVAHVPVDAISAAHNSFARGLLCNLLNPKMGVFYVAFLPQFVPRDAHPVRFMLLLTSIHAWEGMMYLALLVAAASSVAPFIRRPTVVHAIDSLTGVMFLLFGLRMLAEVK